jgi:hypothetical protein
MEDYMNWENIFVLTERLVNETEKLQKSNLEMINSFGKIFEKLKQILKMLQKHYRNLIKANALNE